MEKTERLTVYYLATASAVMLWSASFIATKLAYATFAPVQLGAVRTVIAVIMFRIIRVVMKENEKLRKDDRLKAAVSGLLGLTLYFTVENLGVSMTSASNAALIVASFPAVTLLLEFFIYHKKPSLKQVCGVLMALAGVAVLTQVTAEGSPKALLGNILLFGAGIIWAFYNFISRRLMENYSAVTLTYYQMLAGSILFFPFVAAEGAEFQVPCLTSLCALIYLSAGCSVAAFMLYNIGLRRLSAGVSVSLMNLVPVFGLLFSIIILQETVTPIQVTGGAIVIAGVVLSSR